MTSRARKSLTAVFLVLLAAALAWFGRGDGEELAPDDDDSAALADDDDSGDDDSAQ